jgi:hypothetical protein
MFSVWPAHHRGDPRVPVLEAESLWGDNGMILFLVWIVSFLFAMWLGFQGIIFTLHYCPDCNTSFIWIKPHLFCPFCKTGKPVRVIYCRQP